MPKTIFVNIDDDITRTSRKLAHEPAADVVLVLPKGALMFAHEASIKKLYAHSIELGKDVTIVTADKKGQALAAEAGFALGSVASLHTGRTSMDTVRKPVARAVPASAPVAPRPPVPLHVPRAPQKFPLIRCQKKSLSRNLTRYFIAAAVLAGVLLVVLAVFILPQATSPSTCRPSQFLATST